MIYNFKCPICNCVEKHEDPKPNFLACQGNGSHKPTKMIKQNKVS